ncbi:vacuolar fusion protein MON1 homolog B-like isoform X2 [Pyxicephalus adspersus]|uniref:vacuolar fusion protein MON1 homolog B-like isoform X2 n=1 Tax=Pyxicephalus adspersus TaxID=30357 RepID=UPI003B599F79
MSGGNRNVGMMAEELDLPSCEQLREEEQLKVHQAVKGSQVSYVDPLLPSPLDYPLKKEVFDDLENGSRQTKTKSLNLASDKQCHTENAPSGAALLPRGVTEDTQCFSVVPKEDSRAEGNTSHEPLGSISHFTANQERQFLNTLEQCTLLEEDLKKTPYSLPSKEVLDCEVTSVKSNSNTMEKSKGVVHNISSVTCNIDKENETNGVMLDEHLPPESAQNTAGRCSELNDLSSADDNLKQSYSISTEGSIETSVVGFSNVGFTENPKLGDVVADYEVDLKELTDSASTDNTLEDSGDFPSISSVVGTSTAEVLPPTMPVQREEDVTAESWRTKRRHVFVLSEAGKPIYSRYGNEEALSSTMGVMMALVSFVQSGNNSIRSIHSENQKVVFLQQGPLVLVSVSRSRQSDEQLRRELQYVYYQIISMLTQASVARIFEKKKNYDLRRLLAGSEKILDSLLDLLDTDPGFLLGAVQCLALASSLRDSLSSILTKAITANLVFSILVADHHLVTVVQERAVIEDCRLDPADLHLLLNLIGASSAFQAGEIWTPICLPRFNPDGYFYAYISYLDPQCTVCLVLLSTDKESFYAVSGCKARILEAMEAQNSLQALAAALQTCSYSVSLVGVPELLHFIYKPLDVPETYQQLPQFTSPEPDGPYSSEEERQRLFDLYRYLHCRIHSSSRPLRLIYHVAEKETMLAWVTSKFELYTTFSSLVTKVGAINVITKLLRWIKREEDRLFIRYPPKYSTTPLPGKGGKSNRTDRTDPYQNGFFTGL